MSHGSMDGRAAGAGAGPAGSPEGCTPILEAFRRQAGRSPGTTALVIGGRTLTYRELDLAAAALADRLARLGAGPGRVVCLRIEQSAVAVAGMLAALRVGAAWAVIEPDQPPARMRALLKDTDCAVVMSAGAGPDPAALPEGTARLDVTGLDVGGLAAAGAVPDGGCAEVPEDDPAYIVYTSGSTGMPKGVVVSRGALAASIAPRESVYGAGPSTFVMAMRLSFDGMLGGMFWSFTRGHTLVLPDEKQLRQVAEMAALATRHRATHLVVVPSYYRALLEESLPGTLRLVVVAGEVCTPELVRAHRQRLPGTRLANEYGPTETTISCTVEPAPDPSADRIPIGRPWPGARARVLDERLREVPPGVRGELYIGGPFVALGYAGQPGRTAERFVADPFGRPGERLYRTGDIALVDESGALHYHGRTDQQVKIRGARVELAEIEEVLERHAGIGQAVVLCDAPGGGEPRLVAFLTTATPGGTPPGWAELRAHCAEHLVEQAVPVLFRQVGRMPLNSSGKADRAALRESVPEPVEPASGGGAYGPGRGGEVAEIWAAVLGHDESGPGDNFFAVGGSSLKVIDLHKRLEQRWPGVLRVGELFDLITISAQADALTARLGGDAGRDDETPVAYEL